MMFVSVSSPVNTGRVGSFRFIARKIYCGIVEEENSDLSPVNISWRRRGGSFQFTARKIYLGIVVEEVFDLSAVNISWRRRGGSFKFIARKSFASM